MSIRDEIAINGAGLQGLLLGYRLKKAKIPFHIYEKSDRIGGWVNSFQEEGFFFEKGPRGFSPNGEGLHTLQVIRELGLESELIGSNPDAKRRYILHEGRLQNISSFYFDWLWAMFHDLFAKRGKEKDESIHTFFTRRLGKRAADLFIDPLVTGIWAGDPKQLSMKNGFPDLFLLEKKYRSLLVGKLFGPQQEKDPIWGKYPLVTLKKGLFTLAEALYSEVASNISFGTTYPSAIPCHRDPYFPAASLAVLHIGYHSRPAPYPGFGFLVPSKEKAEILGAVFDSVVFPSQDLCEGQLRLSIMVGGVRNPELATAPQNRLYEIAVEALHRILKLPEPDFFRISRAEKAISQVPAGAQSDRAGVTQALLSGEKKFSNNLKFHRLNDRL